MNVKDKAEHWKEWIIATTIAATVMIGYVHKFIYPRTEGEKLEQRVDRQEHRVAEVEKALREDLVRLSTKMDNQTQLLLELARPRDSRGSR